MPTFCERDRKVSSHLARVIACLQTKVKRKTQPVDIVTVSGFYTVNWATVCGMNVNCGRKKYVDDTGD